MVDRSYGNKGSFGYRFDINLFCWRFRREIRRHLRFSQRAHDCVLAWARGRSTYWAHSLVVSDFISRVEKVRNNKNKTETGLF